jgi:hypothetical protein
VSSSALQKTAEPELVLPLCLPAINPQGFYRNEQLKHGIGKKEERCNPETRRYNVEGEIQIE